MVALSGDGRPAFLAVPIKLRGQVIGVIDLQTAEEGRPWTEDEIALVRAVSDQMALALENVQLFEQTVRRAEREHLVTQISGKIRASTNLEAIVQTAAQELARALGTSRVLVRLGVEEDGRQDAEG
ncbi:MAG: GAF domain-containing protein [Chloroflexi bacterium]|nr:MAG: GAF domain-containing protein [Chloroflexota bacterium]